MTLQFSVFNMSHISKRLVEMKAEELGARIRWKAAAAALGGAAPGPKLLAVVDMALILRELKFQREQLQIDDETMKKHTEMFGPVFKEKLETGASDVMMSFLVTTEALPAVLGKMMAASEGVESPTMIVPILGSVAGASFSSGRAYYTLRAALDAHKEIAQRTIDVVTELTLEKDKTKTIKSVQRGSWRCSLQ